PARPRALERHRGPADGRGVRGLRAGLRTCPRPPAPRAGRAQHGRRRRARARGRAPRAGGRPRARLHRRLLRAGARGDRRLPRRHARPPAAAVHHRDVLARDRTGDHAGGVDGAGEDRPARPLHGPPRLPGVRRPAAARPGPHPDARGCRRRRPGDAGRVLRGAGARHCRGAARGDPAGGPPGAARAGGRVQPAGRRLRDGAAVSIWGGTAVVGAYEHPTRFAPDKTAFQLHAESARGAPEDAGLAIKDVDGFFTSGVGPIGILSLAGHLNLRPSYVDSQAIGGSSFVSHCLHAAAAIAGGLCEVALVTYGSTAASERFAIGTGGGFVMDPPDSFEAPFGPTIVGSYALVAQRHMHEYGTTSEQLAGIAVTMRRHAGLNPAAKYRDPITVEDVLASRVISSPLHLLDCCVISDGGGALVLTSLERARDLKKPPVVVLGAAEALRHAEIGTRDLLDIAARQSGPLALARAGITNADIDLAMVYDSYTITVLATLEALGFCAPGEGGAFCAGGRIGLGGALPVNPDGGGLSSNHPGMRGIFLVI